MSIRRLLGTAAAMAVAAAGLRAVTPDLTGVTVAGPDLQRAVDTAGAETVLLAGVAVLAWAVWLWGALGLTLTALSVLPGAAGTLARALTRWVLPGGARRAAALALGVGLVTGGPLLAGCTPASGALPRAVAVASADGSVPSAQQPVAQQPVADWPATPAPEPGPDRPTSAPVGRSQFSPSRRSMLSSTSSGSLCPPLAKNLIPLSGLGLCDAESMTPRSAPVSATRPATAGVGRTPASSTSTPALARPATTAAARNSPEARGSRPTTARGR